MRLLKLIIIGFLIITTFVVWSLFYDLEYLIDICTLGFSAEQCIEWSDQGVEWVEIIQRMSDY